MYRNCCTFYDILLTFKWGGGGHWPRKGVWGCVAQKTPFSRLSCSLQGSYFKQKSQFTRPPLEKIWNFSLYCLNFHPNFTSQAPKFWNFQLTSPQIGKFSVHKSSNLESFSSQAPPFSEHTSEIRAAHPCLKKSWVPLPRVSSVKLKLILNWEGVYLGRCLQLQLLLRLSNFCLWMHFLYVIFSPFSQNWVYVNVVSELTNVGLTPIEHCTHKKEYDDRM